MYKKKLTFLMMLIFLLTSCSTWEDTKGALTGAKKKSSDEFLVEKKDYQILTLQRHKRKRVRFLKIQ